MPTPSANSANTAKHKKAEVLQQSEARFRAIFQDAGIGIALSDLQGHCVEVNPAFQRLLGYKKEELRKMPFKEYTCSEDIDADLKFASEFVAGKLDNFQLEKRYIRKDGQMIWTHLTVSAIKDAEGKVQYALVMIEDITERKKTEQALKESEERYRQLFSSMTELFEVVELKYDETGKPVDFCYIEVNPAFEQLTGKSKNEVVGKCAREVFGTVDAHWLEVLGKVAKTGKPIRYENYGPAFNKCYESHSWKLNDNQIAVVFSDITARKQLQKHLETYAENLEKIVTERTKRLKESERLAAIGQTAGMVGHDLRNPLQSIIGEVYLANTELKSIPDSEHKICLQESIQAIAEQISYMDKIVSDLQTFVRPVEARIQTVTLKPIIVALLAQANIPENIQTNLCINDAFTVKADPQLLKRVLINLVTNAVQAMPEGGNLTIKAQNNGTKQVQIIVEDTGVGISDEIKPKLFTPLFTTKAKGQGFGLAVCKRVLEAQHGTIYFESQEGKGTKFVVELPSQ